MSTWMVQTRVVVARELRLEGSGREASLTALPYALLVLVFVGLGLDLRTGLQPELAATLTWLVVVTGVLPLTRLVAAADHDDGSWHLLRGLVPGWPLLAGKALSLWLALALLWSATALAAVGLLGATWSVAAIGAGMLGTLGVALNATVFGVLLGPVTRRSGLVATLSLPGAVPVLLAGTRAAEGVGVGPWLTLLVVYDAVLVTVLWALTPLLVEE
jgi:ABC-type transport system involved in cytochrome c biogenesis permease component